MFVYICLSVSGSSVFSNDMPLFITLDTNMKEGRRILLPMSKVFLFVYISLSVSGSSVACIDSCASTPASDTYPQYH